MAERVRGRIDGLAAKIGTAGSYSPSTESMKMSEKPSTETSVEAEPDALRADPVKSRRVGITVSVFLMLISVAITSTFIAIGGSLAVRNLMATGWNQTRGLLITAKAEHAGGKKENPLVPLVRYQFTVNGKTYTSDHWSPAGDGPDLLGQIERLKAASPLIVHYNPRNPADSALVMPSMHLGYLPLTLGIGLFFILVIAVSGGTLFAAIYPEVAALEDTPARRAIKLSLRIGFVLTLTSLTGLVTLLTGLQGGWWQWIISVVGVLVVVNRSRKSDLKR